MAVIDVHAHVYPENLAPKAVKNIGDFYDSRTFGSGTPDDLLSVRQRAPITHFVVHSVALTPHASTSINNFFAEQIRIHPEFIGFMALHPDSPDPEAEVQRAIDMGLCGIKLHPDMQQCDIDDPRYMRIYEIIEGRIPLILHTGDYRSDRSSPTRLVKVLKAFPDLVVDAAHFGFWSRFDVGYDVLKDERVFVDASSSLYFVGERHMRELVRLYGTDRVLFGSDYPMWDPAREYEFFQNAGFSDDELENLLWHNAERFLGRKVE